jgi:GNAT superfamily N-acetyltransferase
MNTAMKIRPADTEQVVIKQATKDDVLRLVDYAKNFWDQTNYAKDGIEYDLETMVTTTEDLIDTDVVLFAENPDGLIVGMLCIMITPFLMNRNYLSACEWGFYVDDEYRRTGIGIRLLTIAEDMLKARNVKYFTMIALSNLRPKAVGRFYESLGFKLEETSYTKDLSCN